MSQPRDELKHLLRRGERAQRWKAQASRDFWARGGICCPACGVEHYSGVMSKQERRYKRARYLIAKIRKDGGQFDASEEQRTLAALV